MSGRKRLRGLDGPRDGLDDRPQGRSGGSSLSQTDTVVAAVKRMIIDGTVSAGSRLPIEKELAVGLNVSRSSLREGIRALAIMGVLETKQGDGTYVTSLEPHRLLAPMGFLVDLHAESDISHLQSVRRVLETEAASRAALTIDDEALARAEAAVTSAERLVLSNSGYQAFMDADIGFHRVIAKASGNPALEALIEALASRTIQSRMRRAMTEEGVVAATLAEHRAILHSLQIHDPDSARLRMGAHLLAVQDFMHSHPTTEPGGFLDPPILQN